MSNEAVAFGLLADRCDEPQVVERRRPETINQTPHVHHGILSLLRQTREQHLGVLWFAPDQLASSFELQGKARERWPQAIMQVAPEAPPLLLSGCDQPFPGALQIRGESDGVHGDLCLSSKVLKQSPIAGGELFAGGSGRDHQAPYLLPLVDERQGFRFCPGRSVGGGTPKAISLLEQDGYIGQLERLGYGLNYRRQHRLWGESRFDAAPQARGHRGRIISLTVHQSIDASLEPAP